MSLLDMINFSLTPLVACLIHILPQEIRTAAERLQQNPQSVVEGDQKARVEANLRFVAETCDKLLLERTRSRVERALIALRSPQPLSNLAMIGLLNTLDEAIEDDLRTEYFFHYRRDRAVRLLTFKGDWAGALSAFPSAEKEIERGLDCYCFEDYDACVFHMMRAAELGMRALARERQVTFSKHPLEWADWQNIIDGIEKSVRALGQSMPRGPAKDAALAFYSGAVGQLHGFKDTFRNAVMHVRKSYDELDAQRAINQVRDFMNGLSAKIGEKTKTPIRRWP